MRFLLRTRSCNRHLWAVALESSGGRDNGNAVTGAIFSLMNSEIFRRRVVQIFAWPLTVSALLGVSVVIGSD